MAQGKYKWNCPILEEHGVHWANSDGASVCTEDCTLDECVLVIWSEVGRADKAGMIRCRLYDREKVEAVV